VAALTKTSSTFGTSLMVFEKLTMLPSLLARDIGNTSMGRSSILLSGMFHEQHLLPVRALVYRGEPEKSMGLAKNGWPLFLCACSPAPILPPLFSSSNFQS
jgi:hypothetical protein